MNGKISAKIVALMIWCISGGLSLISFVFIILIFFNFKVQDNYNISGFSFGFNLVAIIAALFSMLMSHSSYTTVILKKINIISGYLQFLINIFFLNFMIYLYQYADIILFLYLILFVVRVTITILTIFSKDINLEKMYLNAYQIDMTEEEYNVKKVEMSKNKAYLFIVCFFSYGIFKIDFAIFFVLVLNFIYCIIIMNRLFKTNKCQKKNIFFLYSVCSIIFIFLLIVIILMIQEIFIVENTSYKDVSMFIFLIYVPYAYIYQIFRRNLYIYGSKKYII